MTDKRKGTRKRATDLRGASRLAVDATVRVTGIVQEMHGTIGGAPARFFSAPVYASIRGIAKLVGVSVDVVLERLAPLLGDGVAGAQREAAVAVLNGVVGDYLRDTKNPLATKMRLRVAGEPRPRLVVLVHGSSMNDRQWLRGGHDHGAALAGNLDATAVYVHYNTGLHVSENGRELAAELERLASSWPVPVESIALVGHSMGGLVARSACHYAEEAGLAWRDRLRALVCVGTPNLGAPLERIGHLVQLLGGVSRYSAPIAKLGRLRSAGVTDMRFGNVVDEHWVGRDRFGDRGGDRRAVPLPENVACFALAGTTAKAPKDRKKLPGDGLVPVASALGSFPKENVAIAHGVGHLDLLGAGVYPILLEWLRVDLRPRGRSR
jgi:pimeloyl-ACP methyl ester carboxylesterase